MAVDESDEGSLLRIPSDNDTFQPFTRPLSIYKPHNTFTLPVAKSYEMQYDNLYFLRLTKLKAAAEKQAIEAWSGFSISGTEVQKRSRVLDVRQGDLVWVTGTIYMEMPLKPNILQDVARKHWLAHQPDREKWLSEDGKDLVMLEDESGRLRMSGIALRNEMLVTGCVIAVMGTENENGEFEVVDVKVPDLAPQPERWSTTQPPATSTQNGHRKTKRRKLDSLSDDESMNGTDEVKSGSGSKIAIVSGMAFSGFSAEGSVQIDMLLEYLLGEALDTETQGSTSHISRLIIAGNSIIANPDKPSHDTIGHGRKHIAREKYGYDSSAYNPAPIAHLDNFLAQLLPSMPVTLIPGETDPANVSLPQPGIHPAMIPQARAYAGGPPNVPLEEREPGWFDAATNPWDGEIDGWKVLGCGGQNVDDTFHYVEGDDRLTMMNAMMRWRCCAPTCPDTLWSYPCVENDPFVLETCPHLFFAGCQPKFDTVMVDGPDGQKVRLIAVPKFSETGQIVLVDSETLEVEVVKIELFDG